MDSKYILIITNKGDVTTDLVIKRLYKRNVPFRRFNTEDFPQNVNCVIKLNKNHNDFRIITNNWELSSDEVKSVWYRRPKFSEFTEKFSTQDDFNFAFRESSSFLMNLWAVLNNKSWINNPFDLYRAERKAFQLKIANECKFDIPNTLISNHFSLITEFINSHKRNVIVKPISHGGFGKNDEYAIYTTDLENNDYVLNEDTIKSSPFILQEKIKDKYDVRVTIFGEKVFAHKIISAKKSNHIDWRVLKPDEINYELIDIPNKTLESIIVFMHKLNLKYGALDFVVDSFNNWYFIEINPNGQFAWLEIANGDKLIDSLIDLLIA